MKEHKAVPVARVKALLLVAFSDQLYAAVRQHAVAVHQQQLDTRRAALDLRKLIHRDFLFHIEELYIR